MIFFAIFKVIIAKNLQIIVFYSKNKGGLLPTLKLFYQHSLLYLSASIIALAALFPAPIALIAVDGPRGATSPPA